MLTNLDVLVVRARFPADDAGVYAAASAFARVAFFLPAAVLAVLFPRTAARQARGEPTGDILGRALIATAAFCGLLVVAYALAGEGLLATSFGLEFGDGGALLPEYALAISLYSLANVLVGYHLSRGEHRYAWIVAGAVLVQIAVLAFVPDTIEGVIWTNLAIAGGLLAAHELFVESSIPALREGARHLVSPAVAATIRRVAREGVIALGGYAVLAVLITWPLAAHLGSTFIGDERNDAAGTIAWLWRLGEEGGYHLFGTAAHTLTGAPLGWEQGNALNVQWLLPLYPAFLVSEVAGEVVAYNLVILSGLTLSALAMHALARYLGCRPVVAAWAGVAFMLLPWLVWRVNAGHAALVHAWVLPTALLALVAWSMRPTALRAALVGLVATAAWLTYGYFGVMVGIGGLFFVLGAGVVRVRTHGARTVIRQALYPVAAIVGATFAVFVLTIPGSGRGRRDDPTRCLQPLGVRCPTCRVPAPARAPSTARPALRSSPPWPSRLERRRDDSVRRMADDRARCRGLRSGRAAEEGVRRSAASSSRRPGRGGGRRVRLLLAEPDLARRARLHVDAVLVRLPGAQRVPSALSVRGARRGRTHPGRSAGAPGAVRQDPGDRSCGRTRQPTCCARDLDRDRADRVRPLADARYAH